MNSSAPVTASGGVLVLRGAVVLGLLLAALGPTWPGPARPRAPLPVLDVSASMGAAADAPVGPEGEGDRLVFADGVRLARRGEESADLSRGRTRLDEALRTAADVLGDRPGIAWLVTDGLDTEGDALEGARALAARGHRLFVSAPQPPRADVALLSARLEAAGAGVATDVRARVAASVGGRVRVALRRGAAEVDAVEVPVTAGSTADVRLRDPQPAAEPAVYEVSLVPLDGTPDDDLANDRLTLFAGGTEPIVVVFDADPWPSVVEGAPRLRDASGLDPSALDAADLAIVSDVPWRRLGKGGAERLARHVAGGGTLLVLGGPDAWGPGGWSGTPFERLLPLVGAPPPEGETALVVAIDHSGSTGVSPAGGGATSLPALLHALGGLLDALSPDVRVLVLPFTDVPDASPLLPAWVAGADATAKAALAASARALFAQGGTDLARAVVAAARAVAERPSARRRRVILLTDGDPNHEMTAAALAPGREALRAAGAEFAAVVRGQALAATALRSLAAAPEDVALIDAAGDFPEALLAAFLRAQRREEVLQGPFDVVASDAPEAAGLARLRPTKIHRLEVAPGATALASARGPDGSSHPLAASRPVGAGRVVAVAAGPAFEEGAARDAFRRALAPAVARLAAESDRGWTADAEDGRLVVRAPPGQGALRASCPSTGAAATLVETAPGTYAGRVPPAFLGDDVLFAEAEGGPPRPLRLPARPPIEHRAAGVDEALLDALASAGGGRRLAAGQSPPLMRVSPPVPLAPWILLATLVLFLWERARSAPALDAPKT